MMMTRIMRKRSVCCACFVYRTCARVISPHRLAKHVINRLCRVNRKKRAFFFPSFAVQKYTLLANVL